MKDRFDSLFIGINAGAITPLIAFGIYYLLYNMTISEKVTLDEFIDMMMVFSALPAVISIALIGNLAVFSICIWINLNKTARGVLLMTFIYGALIVVLKFI